LQRRGLGERQRPYPANPESGVNVTVEAASGDVVSARANQPRRAYRSSSPVMSLTPRQAFVNVTVPDLGAEEFQVFAVQVGNSRRALSPVRAVSTVSG